MSAQQGQRYRIIAPQPPAGGRLPRTNGVEVTIDRYTSRFSNADGSTLEVVDLVGDVITASENVDYPRGANKDYRNVQWIDEHPDRFELVEDVAEEDPDEETE